MIMYSADWIRIDKEIITEVGTIIFEFIWKGRNKVKRLSLITDIEVGGLKGPHLEKNKE